MLLDVFAVIQSVMRSFRTGAETGEGPRSAEKVRYSSCDETRAIPSRPGRKRDLRFRGETSYHLRPAPRVSTGSPFAPHRGQGSLRRFG